MQLPKFDKNAKGLGRIQPPMAVSGVRSGMAAFELNHHYFDVHGNYLASHEGYEPGADTGAAADALIAQAVDMSPEARAKIAAALGFTTQDVDTGEPKRRGKAARGKAAAPTPEEPAKPGDDEGDGDSEQADDGKPALTQTRGPLAGGPEQTTANPKIGGIDMIGWAENKVQYPFGQVRKAYAEAFPDKPNANTRQVLDGLVAAKVITEGQIGR